MESGTRLALANETLAHRFYYQVRLIRELERRLPLISGDGVLNQSPTQATDRIGVEASDVGVLNAIDGERDLIFSPRRAHLHFLIRSDDVAKYVMHRIDQRRRFHCKVRAAVHQSAEQEQSVDKAMTAALISRREEAGAISVVFLDDVIAGAGKARRRQINHYFSIASLWSLPILYVLTTRVAQRSDRPIPLDTVTMRPRDSNDEALVSQSIVADDVFKVYAFASAATAYVRSNYRPFLLQLTSCSESIERSQYGSRDTGDEAISKMAHKIDLIDRQRIEDFIDRRVESAFRTLRFTDAARLQV